MLGDQWDLCRTLPKRRLGDNEYEQPQKNGGFPSWQRPLIKVPSTRQQAIDG